VIQHLIPGNDDAIRSGRLLCRVIADAVEEGRYILNARQADDGAPSLRAEEKATKQAQARSEAAAAAVERDDRLAGATGAAPSEDVTAEEVPAGEAFAEDVTAEEVPAGEAFAEDMTAEEVPADEVEVVGEAPAEEANAEEVPADEVGETGSEA
jgi:small subunit ribosomal protein S2